MSRDDLVSVRAKGSGAMAFAAGEKYALVLAPGATADRWADGSPITRSEFEEVLAPHAPFEIAARTAPSEIAVSPRPFEPGQKE